MLNEGKVIAMVAVKDSNAAKDFYANKLGLKQVDENQGGVAYESGGGKIFVYQSESAGTNKATSATWEVNNIEEVVKDLQSKGISFEHYEIPGATMDGDVHVMGPMKAAWFKDLDGNILGISSM